MPAYWASSIYTARISVFATTMSSTKVVNKKTLSIRSIGSPTDAYKARQSMLFRELELLLDLTPSTFSSQLLSLPAAVRSLIIAYLLPPITTTRPDLHTCLWGAEMIGGEAWRHDIVGYGLRVPYSLRLRPELLLINKALRAEVQAAYWADLWAKEQGKGGQVAGTVAKAAKMGDYLRYAMYDKYFKKIGNCTSTSCPAGTGKDASHYLLSWYYAWGGATDTSAGWSWRIGSSHAHGGYQNPMAAYALSSVADLKPKSATGQQDWAKSLDRQMDFYQWLQSDEGAIAGGATNSWKGSYSQPPAGTPTFHGMYYDEKPVYHDLSYN